MLSSGTGKGRIDFCVVNFDETIDIWAIHGYILTLWLLKYFQKPKRYGADKFSILKQRLKTHYTGFLNSQILGPLNFALESIDKFDFNGILVKKLNSIKSTKIQNLVY